MTEPARAQPAAHESLGKRLIFWDFARASWQYDVVVALILLFIFATPRDWFHDQPKAASVVLMSSLHGSNRVFIANGLLENVSEQARARRAEALIRQRCDQDGLGTAPDTLAKYFRLHLHRGIGYLFADRTLQSIQHLIRRSADRGGRGASEVVDEDQTRQDGTTTS